MALIGLLSPEGNISLDCNTQQTFSCDVTKVNSNYPVAGWTITGLQGIDHEITQDTGIAAAANPRITTNASNGSIPFSVITITDFTREDDVQSFSV